MAGSDDELARLALIDLESNDGEPQASELKKGYETQGYVQAASLKLTAFKVSAAGIFILGRWLPLQDVGSDALVTFGPDGLYWDVRNPWWGHLSVFFIIMPYVIMWMLISPLTVRVIERWRRKFIPDVDNWTYIWWCVFMCTSVYLVVSLALGRPLWVPFLLLLATCCCHPGLIATEVFSIAFWLVFGLPFCMVLDLMCIVLYPCWQPRLSWLLNAMRLRVVLETILESPAQVGLQTRIFIYKWMSPEGSDMHDDFDVIAFGTLLLSIGTSVLSTALTIQDIRAMSEEQRIGFWETLMDQFLVGLGRKAPLLHVVKFQEDVDWADEGELKDEHFEQISASASKSQALHTLTFHQSNGVSKAGLSSLFKFISQRKHPRMSRVVYDAGRGGDWLWCGCGGFTVEELELNTDIWASGKVHLEFHDIIPAQRIEEIAEEATGSSGCYDRVHVVSAGSSGGHELLQDAALRALAHCLPAKALSIELNFHQGMYMTDSVKALVQSLPVTAIRLNFRGNHKVTDHGLKELVQSLPTAASDVTLNFMKSNNFKDDGLKSLAKGLATGLPPMGVHLNFTKNNNFTDDGLEALAKGLPAKATHIHLDCGGNDKFTDRGLKKLAQRLPAGATDVHLNLMQNNNFSDDGLKCLAKGLPATATRIHLDFMGNDKFTDHGLKELVQSLPIAVVDVHLNFTKNNKFTDSGLEALAEGLRAKATHIHLDCGGNDKFTDRGLKKLAQRLPAGATHVHLNVMGNNNFSDDGLKALAKGLPDHASNIHLNFMGNKKFTEDGYAALVQNLPAAAIHWKDGLEVFFTGLPTTDDGLEAFARGLPTQATHIHLDCGGNGNFSDRGLKKLAESLPAGATSIHLNFMQNNNFSDDGLKALAKGLPDNASNTHLNFMGNNKFSDVGLRVLAKGLKATSIRLNFMGNKKFTQEGLRAFVKDLPAAAYRIRFEFEDQEFIHDELRKRNEERRKKGLPTVE